MTTYRDAVLADSPTHYWTFDDVAGTTGFASAVDGGPTLTVSNVVYSIAEPLISTVDLSSHSILIDPSNSKLGLSSLTQGVPYNISIEAIIKVSLIKSMYIAGFSNSTNYDRHMYIGTDGKLYGGTWVGRQVVGNSISVVSDGLPHHVVMTIDDVSKVICLFVDGLLESSLPYVGNQSQYDGVVSAFITSSGAFGWKASSGSSYFNGAMDELAVYDYLISAIPQQRRGR